MDHREANWNFIADKIDEEQCIIVLGPEVFRNGNGKTLEAQLIEYLHVDSNPNVVKYYQSDGFFLFDEAGGRTLACHQIKTFYENQKANELLAKLCRIPFNIILTLTPDLLVPDAMTKMNLPFQFDYYRKQQEPKNLKQPSKQTPLIYNLFGCIKDEESMVLTHSDLFEYLESVLASSSFPDKLKVSLRSAKNLILIGLDLDKWYLQLLLRLLDIRRNQMALKRFAANEHLNEGVQTFYVEQFKIDFISDNFGDFVDNIYKRCEAKGILRSEAESGKLSVLDKVKALISEGELEAPIEMLKDFLEELDEALYDMVVGLAGKYKRFKRKSQMGTLSREEESVQTSIIIENLLELVNEARELE